MKARTHQSKQAINKHQWLAHVKAQKKSGINRKEYCKQYDLSYNARTYWTGKERPSPKIKPTLVPVPFKSGIVQSSFRTEQVDLRINLSGKISVEVGDNFSASTLTRLLDTLEAR